MFLAGNNVYWKIRWESDFRTMVVYKESQSTEKIDPNSTLTRQHTDPINIPNRYQIGTK